MPKYAVLVVDVLNDFVDGLIGQPHAINVIEPCKTILAAARECNVPVIYANDAHVEGDHELTIWGNHAMKGTHGGAVYADVAPQEGDIVIEKHTYTGFHGTNLDETLKELGVDSLIVMGLYANICCRLTCLDGFIHGYQITIARDAMTSFDPNAYESDLEYLKITCGADALGTDEIIALIKA